MVMNNSLTEVHPELVSANLELSAMKFNLVNAMSREITLKNYLSQVKNRYDYVIIDCMPSLGMVRDKISLEDRVKLIGDVESLHTFAHIINRTRRRDIGNFTLRKPETLKVSFHPSSKNVSIGKTAIYTTNCILTIVRIDEKTQI